MTRVDCPLCGRNISLTAAGNFRYHRHPRHDWHCHASWLTPLRADELAATQETNQ